MKVSIIVPVYKVEEYISKCIDSVLSQSFADFELILVNDGSPDNSGKICDEYAKKDSRIKVFHKENKGPASSVNLGINKSSGEYITFLDSDDWIERTYIEELYNAIEENDCDIVICDYMRAYTNNIEYCSSCKIPEGLHKKEEIIKEMIPFIITDKDKSDTSIISHTRWGKLFKRDTILKNLSFFYEDVRWGEDFLLTLPCICDCEKLYYLKGRFLYNYRYNRKSLINSYSKDFADEIFKIPQYLTAIMDAKNICDNNQIYYFYVNCFINCINKISNMFGIYKYKDIMKEIRRIVNLKQLREFQYIKENKLTKKQSFYMFLIKNRMYFLIYSLLVYFQLKQMF